MDNKFKLFDAEYKFMEIVWKHEPVNSTELTKICDKILRWKKPTTYSMIKKLCARGILKNEKATVSTLIAQEDVKKYEVEVLLDKFFGGSVPALIMTYMGDKFITKQEAMKIKLLADGITERGT